MSLVGNLAGPEATAIRRVDRKSTRLNSSHSQISYAVFCLKKKTNYFGTKGYTNLVELAALQTRVASDLGARLRTLTTTSKSAHIYQTEHSPIPGISAAPT